MTFLIADTFTDSLARLSGDEQRAAKTTAFDLQMNPANPGFNFHRLDKAKDKNFWSVRVNADVRLIVHRTPGSLLLCYVDHHDRAYDWAERRKLETHPKTGAAQLVEIRETVREIVVPVYTQADGGTSVAAVRPAENARFFVPQEARPLFDAYSDDDLLAFGVPEEWLKDVRGADEDTILSLAGHLPGEAAEALLEVAVGGSPQPRPTETVFYQLAPDADPEVVALGDALSHPDAQRRFRVVESVEELQRALDAPWEKWTVFLHPQQREWVEKDYTGPARVAGSAGTGKTIVALHRAVHLARRHPDARVLLASFSDPLAHALQTRLRRLVANEPRIAERVEVYALEALGVHLHRSLIGPVTLATRDDARALVRDASSAVGGHRFTLSFLVAEWEQIVDAWQLDSWEAYRDVARLGRKTRLPEAQRTILWAIFDRVRTALAERNLKTLANVFQALATVIAGGCRSPFDFVVVDEAQDLTVTQLRFFAAIGVGRPNALFFAGDLGQRIFQAPFSWRSLGVDIRGRSRTLRVNYRTSHQIRQQADRLLGTEIADVDGNRESRRDAISVFNGPPPDVRTFAGQEQECGAVARWLKAQVAAGVRPQEIGIFVRPGAEIPRATMAADAAGLSWRVLDNTPASDSAAAVSIGTMHDAKGLEFRAVVVMACDDEVLPLQDRIENVGDDADLEEVYDTERHLLYVACTRARDALLVTAAEPGSEFLGDMGSR
jgi:superfamily I DNA/RNA helicase